MRLLNFVFISLLFISCLTQKNYTRNIEGSFIGKGKDFVHEIKLNNNGTFNLVFKYPSLTKQCNGTWSYLSNDSLSLKCSEVTDPLQSIRSDYMGETTTIIKIINKNKLKMKAAYLLAAVWVAKVIWV